MINRNSTHPLTLLLALTSLFPFFTAQRAWALPHPQQQGQQALDPLLTTISKDPELSIFYSLFNSTGGTEGKPGPALEERFNDARDGRGYTAFAPTNEAFSQLPPEVMSLLTQPPSYELLLSLLRTHIAQGFLPPSSLLTGSPIETIQGFTLTFTQPPNSTATTITTNAGTTTSSPADGSSPHPLPTLLHDASGPTTTRAANGLVYKTSRLLNPFPTYFGVDAAASSPPPPAAVSRATMADVLATHPSLSTLAAALRHINPDFLTRLSLFAAAAAEDDEKTVYLAPGNGAWGVLPGADAFAEAVRPSNEGASAWLLGFGLGEVVGAGGGGAVVRERGGDLVFGVGGLGSTFGTSGAGGEVSGGERKCDLVFGVGGWRCRGEKVRREASGADCDLVFGVGGWKEVCRRGGGRVVEKREASARKTDDGCDWRFGVGGWKKYCPRNIEKRTAEANNPDDSGCDWRFGVGGWKKFCPRGSEQLEQRAAKKKCDWQFGVGGWKEVCPRSYERRSARLAEKRQEQMPTSGVVRSVSGFNITWSQGRANNARVEAVVCAENGCVWILGRWLDPLYGVV